MKRNSKIRFKKRALIVMILKLKKKRKKLVLIALVGSKRN